MRIGAPEVDVQNGLVKVSAVVETDTQLSYWPETLWFEFPEAYAPWIHSGPEPYLVALISAAMALGEAVELDQALSPKLHFHLNRYQSILHYLEPKSLNLIKIHADGQPEPSQDRGDRVATMFSAGVDSLYSLWSHHPNNEDNKAYAISDALFIYFGLSHHHRKRFDTAAAHYQAALARLGVNLIAVHSNIRHFALGKDRSARSRWVKQMHRAELASTGLVISGRLSKLYIPSGWDFTYAGIEETGSVTSQMFSTERMDVLQQGNVATRAAKVEAIVRWRPAQELLHVCLWNTYGLENCGRCPKCVRTMTTLDILGLLPAYKTFPKPKGLTRLRWMGRSSELLFSEDNLVLARRHVRYGYRLRLGLFIAWAKTKRAGKRLIGWLMGGQA